MGLMGEIIFDRPIGVKADLAELFYISALMQTDMTMNSNYKDGRMHLREDGTVNTEDLAAFLISRHGIQIEPKKLQEVLMDHVHVYSLHEDRLDLVQILALMFIPQLCKFAASAEERGGLEECLSPCMLQSILEMILHDVLDKGDDDDNYMNNEVVLNKEFMRRILIKYGENSMADDEELVEEMVAAALSNESHDDDDEDAISGKVIFDTDCFTRALTADVANHFKIENENKYSTIYDDAFKGGNDCRNFETIAKQKMNLSVEDASELESPEKSNFEEKEKSYRVVNTSGIIDYIAIKYACPYTVMVIWIFFYFFFFGYLTPLLYDVQQALHPDCDTTFLPLSSWYDGRAMMKCNVAFSVINWVSVFLLMPFLGMVLVIFGSLVSALYSHRIYDFVSKCFTYERAMQSEQVPLIYQMLLPLFL